MNNHRDSTGEGIWIILALGALLLLACGGGFMWVMHQRSQRATDVAQQARMEAEVMALRQAEMAAQNAEDARAALLAQSDAMQAAQAEQDAAEAQAQPLVPALYLNQDLWQHIATLADAEPDARVFTIDPASGELIFGDGEHGAALPDGPATIQATYQTASGGTITVSLPETDLRHARVRATQSPDGTLKLEVVEPTPEP